MKHNFNFIRYQQKRFVSDVDESLSSDTEPFDPGIDNYIRIFVFDETP